MRDEEIVKLYWARNERAISESSAKYGSYCMTIAGNILSDDEDAKECVNDTWLHAWNSMPPQKPSFLSSFLGKITRNLSFNRYREKHRAKRGGNNITLILEELEDIVSGNESPEEAILKNELKNEIDNFLSALPDTKKYMFIRRYWYADSIAEIARRFATTDNNVSVTLSRIRKELRSQLRGRGYII
ncbi:MAG: sigma-70 family RNA polymerase sigma factor [Lachnospiraceae bacterium]|nr:sigma-70 family RNA polymerase sigma factor [Lachnospiraceae bacterium]